MAVLQTLSAPREATLREVLGKIDEISTLPQIALRVMEVANAPDSGAADLKEVMESDASLSARVLRCVNSSAYATRPKISSLQQAVAYLGMEQIRNLAMTASVSELFKTDESIGPYRRSDLWRHLISVGVCARLIALRRNVQNFEDAFLAGLLHDIGIVLEDQHMHESFCEIVQSLSKEKTLAEVECAHLGFDHTMLAEKLAETWGFAEGIKAAIRYHHTSIDYRGPDVDLVRCVEVANLICTLKGISSVGLKLVRFSQPALDGLKLGKKDIVVLAEDLQEELSCNASLFQM